MNIARIEPSVRSEPLLGPEPILILEIPGEIVSGNRKTRSAAVPAKTKAGQAVYNQDGSKKYRAITYSTKEARAFEDRVRSIATYEVLRARWRMVDWCRVDMVLYNLRLDRGNASKTIEDALQGIVLKNDGHVLDGWIRKGKDSKGPRAVLRVQAVNPADYGY